MAFLATALKCCAINTNFQEKKNFYQTFINFQERRITFDKVLIKKLRRERRSRTKKVLCKETALSVKIPLHQAKAKEKAESFFGVCCLFIDLPFSLSLLLVVNRPLDDISIITSSCWSTFKLG